MSATQSITPHVLQERLETLAQKLSTRDDALALLALGSVGIETDRLDSWSDLDFFVVVRNGAKGRYIENLDWLNAAYPLVWHFQNTVDGHKGLMADGVFCEFAVFETHELSRIPYAPGRFIWRRDEVNENLAFSKQSLPGRHDPAWLVGEALSNLLVGLQRHARGEKLAAMRLIQVHSLDRVLEFMELQQRGAQDKDIYSSRDPFSVDRRIEARCSHAAIALPNWAGGYEYSVPAALALLSVLESHNVVAEFVSTHIRKLATMSITNLTNDS